MIRAYITLKYAYIYIRCIHGIHILRTTHTLMHGGSQRHQWSFLSISHIISGQLDDYLRKAGVWAQSQHPEDLKELLGLEDESYLLVSIPTHYCMFLLFVFVFVYRRRICWGTMSCCQELHDMRSCWRWLDPGICHGVWTGRVEASLGRFPAGLLRIAPVMSDWLVILEQFKGWWRYVGVCFLVGGVVNRAIRNLKFTEEITGSTFLFLQRTIRFSFHVFTGVYTTDIGVYAWIF